MGFFDLLKRADINAGAEEYRKTEHAVLLDVRTGEEYDEGHIPGSRNLDVSSIHTAPEMIADKQTPIFVYCRSGARSSRAVAALKNMGYSGVTDIGGILGYRGPIERGRK